MNIKQTSTEMYLKLTNSMYCAIQYKGVHKNHVVHLQKNNIFITSLGKT